MKRGIDIGVIEKLKAVLGPAGWSEDPDRLAAKLRPYRGPWRGNTPLLALPDTTAKVAEVVALCNAHGAGITTQGGNTGLVGAQIPDGEILLSLERMRAIREILPLEDLMIVEAGVTLLEAQQAALAANRFFALRLASEGSATIGGVISTNAGGTQVLRHGMMRELVLGIEAVMPDGAVLRGLKRLRKDNTGYDLKQLLIGAEGTLGIVTAAVLKLSPIMRSHAMAFVGVRTAGDALQLLGQAKAQTGGGVEAFELISRCSIEMALRFIPDTREPLADPCPWYVLLELVSAEPDGAAAAMERVLSSALDQAIIVDAVVAHNKAQERAFWRLREELSEAQRIAGGGWYHDVSLPISRVAAFLEEATAAVERRWPGAKVMAFGHLGDGNIHFNVAPPSLDQAAAFVGWHEQAQELIYDIVCALGGSISAEHGLGVMKRQQAIARKDPVEIAIMRNIRSTLDPNRILNPRVLF